MIELISIHFLKKKKYIIMRNDRTTSSESKKKRCRFKTNKDFVKLEKHSNLLVK